MSPLFGQGFHDNADGRERIVARQVFRERQGRGRQRERGVIGRTAAVLGPRPLNLVQIKTAAIGSSEKVHRRMTNFAGLTAGNTRRGRRCDRNGRGSSVFGLRCRVRRRFPEVGSNVLGFPVRVPVHRLSCIGCSVSDGVIKSTKYLRQTG